MSERAIVRDSSLFGRWRLEGTMIRISEIRNYSKLDQANLGQVSTFPRVSPGKVAAALNFQYPAIQNASFEEICGTIIVRCVCGEEVYHTVRFLSRDVITCVCDRRWRVNIALKAVHSLTEAFTDNISQFPAGRQLVSM